MQNWRDIIITNTLQQLQKNTKYYYHGMSHHLVSHPLTGCPHRLGLESVSHLLGALSIHTDAVPIESTTTQDLHQKEPTKCKYTDLNLYRWSYPCPRRAWRPHHPGPISRSCTACAQWAPAEAVAQESIGLSLHPACSKNIISAASPSQPLTESNYMFWYRRKAVPLS